ncbi:hypothetical protein [Halarcobacter bivalviorum]|uniref:Prepilin-type N-terminal cleavage/methylation domain-containing protein n=1 Tax=Halarcobacter bivalviorum TaxID=663364 RepID=A0AAX2A5M4_9BACT|nr:hypothetical protein [Halarcobacter bivalviorum]AXH11644.1 hypothetical protein ABIV_0631 [Halarcobacter bivalviorum]RXK08857.1 hypothetical protein CRV05_13075 [Halarcobacter bivalviorum]
MKKLAKSEKNSFTLLETIISILLLSIIISGFSNISSYDNFDEEYILLNKIENSFTLSSYDSTYIKNNQKLTLKINDIEEKDINIKKIEYSNEKIRLFKYEL